MEKKNFEVTIEKLEEIISVITERLCEEKTPAKEPIAFVIGGQPGAGKTGLIGKTLADFENAVVLDVDDYRYFHPEVLDIFKQFPEELVPLTKDFVNTISRTIVKRLIEKKYNLILHKTLKDDEIVGDTLIPLQQNGYFIAVRTMAVCELESRVSALERSLAFKNHMGWCRWVTSKNHEYAYNGIPTTTKQIFDEAYADVVQVYGRGDIPTSSVLMYSLKNAEMCDDKEISKLAIFDEFNTQKYTDAEHAMIKVRELETQKVLSEVFYRLQIVRTQIVDSSDEKYIAEVEEMAQKYLAKSLEKTPYMNNNTKLELAKEVMARMIAVSLSNGFDRENEKLMTLLAEEKEMNKFNEEVIDKIIKVYAPLVKDNLD